MLKFCVSYASPVLLHKADWKTVRWRTRFLVAFLVSAITYSNSAQALEYVRFNIKLDGKPIFIGGNGRMPPKSYFDVLKDALPGQRFQRAPNSLCPRNTTTDFSFNGNIVFEFENLPDMQLQKLRMIYDPETRDDGSYTDDYPNDWKLDLRDSSKIVAYYQRRETNKNACNRLIAMIGFWFPFALYGSVVVSLIYSLYWIRMRRRTHPETVALPTSFNAR